MTGGSGLTVYIDAVFLLNMLINAALLHATARARGAPMRRGRFWLAAALGGLYAVACYVPGLQFCRLWSMKFIAMALMLLVSFGFRRQSVWDGLMFLLLSVGLCGLVYFVTTLLGKAPLPSSAGIYPVTFPELLLTTGLAAFCARLAGAKAAVGRGERLLRLCLRLGGTAIPLTALHDTGNSLRDPVSGAPVTVVSADALVQAIGRDAVRAVRHGDLQAAMELLASYRPRLIPYRAVGVSGGLLVALRCELQIGMQVQKNALIALSPTPVCDSGSYAALVGGTIHERSGKNSALFSAAVRRKDHVHQRQRRAAAAPEKRRGAADAAAHGGR